MRLFRRAGLRAHPLVPPSEPYFPTVTSASDVWERAVLSEASANDLVIHHIDGNPPNNEVANLVVGPAGSSSGVPWDGSASPTWAAIAMAHRRASLGLDELRGAMGFLVGDQPDLDKPYDYRRDRAALQEWLNAPIPSLTTVDAAHSHILRDHS